MTPTGACNVASECSCALQRSWADTHGLRLGYPTRGHWVPGRRAKRFLGWTAAPVYGTEMANSQEQKYQMPFAWSWPWCIYLFGRRYCPVLSLSFNLWVNQNDSTVHPVNQKDRVRDHSFALLLLGAFIRQVLNMEKYGSQVYGTQVCAGKTLYITMLNFLWNHWKKNFGGGIKSSWTIFFAVSCSC